jgi:hypothetical protein
MKVGEGLDIKFEGKIVRYVATYENAGRIYLLFIQNINECTNVSIGYFNEHTNNEYQNITFLENLCKACVNIDWENLIVARKIGYNKEIIERNLICGKINHFIIQMKD